MRKRFWDAVGFGCLTTFGAALILHGIVLVVVSRMDFRLYAYLKGPNPANPGPRGLDYWLYKGGILAVAVIFGTVVGLLRFRRGRRDSA